VAVQSNPQLRNWPTVRCTSLSSINPPWQPTHSRETGLCGAWFSIKIYTRGCTEMYTRVCHWFPRVFAENNHACDQFHSHLVFIPLTGWHCILHPITKGPSPTMDCIVYCHWYNVLGLEQYVAFHSRMLLECTPAYLITASL
jgi:uncharacterized protein YodC (DUF2158 family)